MLTLLVLANICYLYGTSFRQHTRLKALDILVVDLDGGYLGDDLAQAAQSASQLNSFPTVHIGEGSAFPDPSTIRRAVCHADYWAAVYLDQNASASLDRAFEGSASSEAVRAITYTYNQARYPTMADSVLLPSIQTLIGMTTESFYRSPRGIEAFSSLNASDPNALATLLYPVRERANLIQPTQQTSRIFHNTVNTVVPPLTQFFFVMALNGIGLATGQLASVRIRDVWLLRFCVGKAYALISSLAMTGWIWGFREEWDVGGVRFAKTWMVLWFCMDTQWQVMESIVGSFLPMEYTPFFVFTWVITNVASSVFPLEIMPSFYKVGYVLPMRSTYSLLVQVWSGCANEMHISLTVPFVWWAVGHIVAVFSVRKRCFDAEKISIRSVTSSSTTDTETDAAGENLREKNS